MSAGRANTSAARAGALLQTKVPTFRRASVPSGDSAGKFYPTLRKKTKAPPVKGGAYFKQSSLAQRVFKKLFFNEFEGVL